MFSSVFDSDASEAKIWSNFSWETGCSPGPGTTLEYVINHVFCPVHYQPKKDDFTEKNAHALAQAVYIAACGFNDYIDEDQKSEWSCITSMLQNLCIIVDPSQPWNGEKGLRVFMQPDELYLDPVIRMLDGMKLGDILIFPASYRDNVYGVIFRRQEHVTACELVHPSEHPARGTGERSSYPGLVIIIPNHEFDDGNFRSHLAYLLLHWVSETLIAMLRRSGEHNAPKSIMKRTCPSCTLVNADGSFNWCRSHLWFFIKFAIQSSLDFHPRLRQMYKTFLLFLVCSIANHANNTNFAGILLHSMSAKILRRFSKHPSIPQWLCDAASHTCTRLSETLDRRRKELITQSRSVHRDSLQLNLSEDIHASLSHISQFISSPSCKTWSQFSAPSFVPDCRLRSTFTDFLSNLTSHPEGPPDHDDIHVMLYDIEQAIGNALDDWVAGIANTQKACEQLECLAYRYHLLASDTYSSKKNAYDPDHQSIMLLTIIEIWVALDKLVIEEFPILADYSPEIPTDLLSGLILRDANDVCRLRRAHQYLAARHKPVHTGWSLFSSQFTEDSFPCRYYDNSPDLQHLRVSLHDALPADPVLAKIIVFELRCPISLDTWRCVTALIFHDKVSVKQDGTDFPVNDVPVLRPHISARSSPISLHSSSPTQRQQRLYYIYTGIFLGHLKLAYKLPSGPYTSSGLQSYLDNTTHTSNEVLANQSERDLNLSSHEFIAFAHLRSGGSLQWFNILRELRSRTLDFRHQETYLLLAQASTQVGPLDSTGELLIWHEELQDASFCYTLLEELESLFTDIGAGSSDGRAMASISLLAAALASKAPQEISERAIQLLRNVRLRTLRWVHELLYNTRMSPANKESLVLLRDMAAICRSTFDVTPRLVHKLLHSVQDIEAALSCTMIIRMTFFPAVSDVQYSQVLLSRDRHLSLMIEEDLRDAIQADTTDLGIDHAVSCVWPGYRPSPHRWEPLPSPSSRWLACETALIGGRRSQTVHINLLDGSLLVDGRPSGHLPSDITSDSTYRELFGTCDLMVVPSDRTEMDFVTVCAIYKHHVHFAIRNVHHESSSRRKVVIRAENADGDIFELIPREDLQAGLPKLLVEGHIHWLHLSTSVIEIRPTDKPWEQLWGNNWIANLRTGQSRVTRGGEVLVDNRSTTWDIISSRLRCIEYPENLIMTTSPVGIAQSTASLRLVITLPRYDLSFFVNEGGDLQSCDYDDMVYDEDQCIGTLFGLVTRLILRPKVQLEEDLIPKYILVPYCNRLYQNDGNVYVHIPPTGHVNHFAYQVDSELGCLKGSATLESRIYLARLHALTSNGCRPDPLTGRTGVEEAVSLIWLAGTRQQTNIPSSESQSFQIRFALQRLQGQIDPRGEDHDGLLQEFKLFPSEFIATHEARSPRKFILVSLGHLLSTRPPPVLWERDTLSARNLKFRSNSTDIDPLRELFSTLKAVTPFQSQYISRLHNSAHKFQTSAPCLCGDIQAGRSYGQKPGAETLRLHYSRCRTAFMQSFANIKMVLGPNTEFECILDQCGQWPRLTPFILFQCLAPRAPGFLPQSWKICLIMLALLALDLQQARRLLRLALDNLEEEFYQELENEGCHGWDPVEFPDWLLIQLQCNFLIRGVQADIAKEMMFPQAHHNAVMQVNMGEGKTSVIIPICAAALANGKNLVRVIVPKPLVQQTLQVLSERLCGLVGRPICHLTFSRGDLNLAVDKLEVLRTTLNICSTERGIIVMQPEHVLSLKLACVETLLLRKIWCSSPPTPQKWGFEHIFHMITRFLMNPLAKTVYASTMTQRPKEDNFLPEVVYENEPSPDLRRATCLSNLVWYIYLSGRDILDESDEVLDPKFQLIYTLGPRYPLEDSPNRWLVIQKVLERVKHHAYLLSSRTSQTLRCDGNPPGSFPHIHILRPEGGENLVSLIADDVLDGHFFATGLGFHSELVLRGAIRDFISRDDIHPDTVKMVEQYARHSIIWGSLLLLRGLLAYDILLFALTQRRWRVDYGLDLSTTPRTMLAIPYRAKDVPTETAEFGHPDITILLTCLSYYYGGLTQEQLRASFELLLHQDDPTSEYTLWVQDCDDTLPFDLRTLSGINIRSLEQWATYLVPIFTRNKQAVDIYLSGVVFAKHAKEYPRRISASYWEIAETKVESVTGFSGTSDAQYLLPTSIVQYDRDDPQQTGTNARALAYLLQPENSSYMVMTDEHGERWSTSNLLKMIVTQDPPIRVLIDVGAQILDLSNLQLAKAWLGCTTATETAGAVHFNEDDQLMVVTRNGTVQSLASSPLVRQLHRCVTYLDHAHTRGVDLKFPNRFRAAITLGSKITKDRLVQGCMRMRKLGNSHSVMFFAPHEVDRRIRDLVSKENGDQITTADILRWAIHETWSDLQRQAPYWAQQAITHQSRFQAWAYLIPGSNDDKSVEKLEAAWVQTEFKSLSDMYAPHHRDFPDSMELTHEVRDTLINFGILSLPAIHMDEEREREVSRETEREREVEKRPPKALPARHSIHPDVVRLVESGTMPPSSVKELATSGFRRIFAHRRYSTSVRAFPFYMSDAQDWSPCIFATVDFCATITGSGDPHKVQRQENSYLRPVHWVLSAKKGKQDFLVLISPFEADQLMPKIKTNNHLHLHLYIPRTTKRMKPCDDLRMYSVPHLPSNWTPPWTLICQLNVFAGQLYLGDYASYVRMCGLLGVCPKDPTQKTGRVLVEKSLENADPSVQGIVDRFNGTRVPVVMQILAARMGMGFAATHMGNILEGWPLTEKDFKAPLRLDPIESPPKGGGLVEGEEHDIFTEPNSAEEGDGRMSTGKRRVTSPEVAGRQSKRERLEQAPISPTG